MPDSSKYPPSSLGQYLPAIYRDREHPFLGRFLLAFEKVLIGLNDRVEFPKLGDDVRFPERGIEETIGGVSEAQTPEDFLPWLAGWVALSLSERAPLPWRGVSDYFDPAQTPEDFLPWLAGWVALSLRADLEVKKQRDFIANAIRLYRRRGTQASMVELLGIFTDQKEVTVKDDLQESHRFQVEITLAERDAALIKGQQAIAHALIELEKPAHTDYELILFFPSMEIGNCYVGIDTLLSTSNVAQKEK
jgi:phage tail-like protein